MALRRWSMWKMTTICHCYAIQPFWLDKTIWPHYHTCMNQMYYIRLKHGWCRSPIYYNRFVHSEFAIWLFCLQILWPTNDIHILRYCIGGNQSIRRIIVVWTGYYTNLSQSVRKLSGTAYFCDCRNGLAYTRAGKMRFEYHNQVYLLPLK